MHSTYEPVEDVTQLRIMRMVAKERKDGMGAVLKVNWCSRRLGPHPTTLYKLFPYIVTAV